MAIQRIWGTNINKGNTLNSCVAKLGFDGFNKVLTQVDQNLQSPYFLSKLYVVDLSQWIVVIIRWFHRDPMSCSDTSVTPKWFLVDFYLEVLLQFDSYRGEGSPAESD